MPVETPTNERVALETGYVDARGLTITTAIALAAHQALAVDPDRLAVGEVVVCEYLTFMEVMRRADVQLYT